VVHHLIVFVLPPGQRRLGPGGVFSADWLAAYAPGLPPRVLDEGVGKVIPAGARLVFQVHYTPNGAKQTDLSRVGLTFANPRTIQRQLTSAAAVEFRFRIPPHAEDYKVEASHRFMQDYLLYALIPHMHLRGKSFLFEAVYPNGCHEILLDVPRYDFNWQNVYELTEPKRMPEGTVLHCVAHFDNSSNNLANPDPSITVTWGDQTWDEMMVGYFDAALADQDLTFSEPTIQPKGEGHYEVTFRYKAPKGSKSCYLAGTFNDWKPNTLAMDGPDADGAFTVRLTLKPGNYEYKYVIEGKHWRHDPGNRRQAGYYNHSVLIVPGR
jgi:hypothetical protein